MLEAPPALDTGPGHLLTVPLPTVLGVGLPVVPGDLRHQLGLQQHVLLLSLHHARGQHAYPQALRVRGLQLRLLTAPLQPAGGRLLHHPGEPGRGQRQHVQEHPGELEGPLVLLGSRPVLTTVVTPAPLELASLWGGEDGGPTRCRTEETSVDHQW